MLTQYRTLNTLFGITMLLLVSILGVWFFAPVWFYNTVFIKLICLGAGGLTVSALLLYSMQIYRAEQQKLQIYAELVCDLDQDHDFTEKIEEIFPDKSQGRVWSHAFRKIRSTLVGYNDRILEATHARHGAEVRLKKIAEYCKQLEQILSMIEEPVLAVNGFRELFFANRNGRAILEGVQAPRSKADGEDELTLKLLRDCNHLVHSLQETSHRATTSHRYLELDLPNDEGNTVAYRASIKTLTNGESSEVIGAVACLTDISSHRELQKKHAQFVSNVSHEMKTPLAGIRAYIELLMENDAEDPVTRQEFLGIIDSQATRLQRLIDNLLNIARIEAGVVNVSKRPQSLNAILEESVEIIKVQAEQKDVQFKLELSSMYLGVYVDRDMIMQTAINLLSNAIKYTPSGGTVTLRSFMDEPYISFSVSDTGVGLSEEDQQKVFEKFYRVKKDSKMASGTGLGLPLAKHIVEDVHSGRLLLTSVEGQGSTFSVSLPAANKQG